MADPTKMELALAQLAQENGEATTGFLTASDLVAAFGLLQEAWQEDATAAAEAVVAAAILPAGDIDNAIDAVITAGIAPAGVIDNAIDALITAHVG